MILVLAVFFIITILIWTEIRWLNPRSINTNSRKPFETRKQFADSEPLQSTNQSITSHITSINDPGIVVIWNKLKDLEQLRSRFCRQFENENSVYYEYLIKTPDTAEAAILQKTAASAKGVTLDSNRERIAWNARLIEDFLPSPEFEYLVVLIEYNKSGGLGHYSVTGIPKGKLSMRDGQAPISSDSKIYPLKSDVAFKFDSNWRYSNILDSD